MPSLHKKVSISIEPDGLVVSLKEGAGLENGHDDVSAPVTNVGVVDEVSPAVGTGSSEPPHSVMGVPITSEVRPFDGDWRISHIRRKVTYCLIIGKQQVSHLSNPVSWVTRHVRTKGIMESIKGLRKQALRSR